MRDANAWRIPRSLFLDELSRDRSSPELSRDTVTVDAVKYYLNIYERLSNRECRAKWTLNERDKEDRGERETGRKQEEEGNEGSEENALHETQEVWRMLRASTMRFKWPLRSRAL